MEKSDIEKSTETQYKASKVIRIAGASLGAILGAVFTPAVGVAVTTATGVFSDILDPGEPKEGPGLLERLSSTATAYGRDIFEPDTDGSDKSVNNNSVLGFLGL